MRVRPPGWPIAALALAVAVAAATPPNHLVPESEAAGDSGARMEWVNSSGVDQGLTWTTEERSSRVLVGDRAGFVFVERRLRRAVDDMGYRYVEPTQALPAGT